MNAESSSLIGLQSQARPFGSRLRRSLWVPLLAVLVCELASQVHYLLFHTTAEFISIIIAMTGLVVSTTSRTFTRNHFVVYVSVVMGWSAVLDFFHVLSYPGMDLVDSIVRPELYPATQTWILARFIQALALLCAPLFLTRGFRVAYLHLILGGVVTLALVWVISGTFPAVFVEGQGLTPFKVYAEYLIMLLLAITMWLLWQRRKQTSNIVLLNMQVSLGLMILSELAFTMYASVYDRANEIGHIFKIFSAWFIYQALIERTLIDPFRMLSRTASTYDAVPFPALVVDQAGLIQQANRAAAQFSGLATETMVGLSVHKFFHDAASTMADCPVCARLARGEEAFTVEFDVRETARTLECTVAPFIEGVRRDRRRVQVVRDVTEHKKLAAERELLLHNLSERVKEASAQYAVSEILATPEMSIPSLLEQVAAVLPPGFLVPERARVAIVCDWGTFGAEGSADATPCLRSNITVARKVVGEIRVFYKPALPMEGDPFLPEEYAMMSTVAQRVGGRIERRLSELQITSYVKQLEASRRGTLQAVSNMIDLRDPYTAGHERRVGLIAGAIARELGWDEHRCEMMELTGLVHDIGKIAIPAEILSKPGRLSSLEMDLMHGHAQAGYDILKDVPFDFPVAEIIYQHHERLDGSGYPRALHGDGILPEARILAVADVLESMAAHRPYRPALGLEAALQELQRGRGTHYDPVVVDAAHRLLHEKGYVLPQ